MAKKILLVDDDRGFRSTVASVLERAGVNVAEVPDGIAALEYLGNNSPALPDLIVSDLNMPLMDGGALCQRVRELSAYNAIPFVILSATVETDGANLTNIPADLCLSKQSPLADILAQLQDLIAE